MKDIVSVETIIWVQKTDQSKNQTVLEKIKWPCPGAFISMPNNVNSCQKKSTKRLKRPTSLIIQGQARSSVLKTQNNKLGKLKRIFQYLWTDFLSFPSPVSCCSYPLGVHSDGHIWSSRYDFCSGKLCLISIGLEVSNNAARFIFSNCILRNVRYWSHSWEVHSETDLC